MAPTTTGANVTTTTAAKTASRRRTLPHPVVKDFESAQARRRFEQLRQRLEERGLGGASLLAMQVLRHGVEYAEQTLRLAFRDAIRRAVGDWEDSDRHDELLWGRRFKRLARRRKVR